MPTVHKAQVARCISSTPICNPRRLGDYFHRWSLRLATLDNNAVVWNVDDDDDDDDKSKFPSVPSFPLHCSQEILRAWVTLFPSCSGNELTHNDDNDDNGKNITHLPNPHPTQLLHSCDPTQVRKPPHLGQARPRPPPAHPWIRGRIPVHRSHPLPNRQGFQKEWIQDVRCRPDAESVTSRGLATMAVY
ncbi:predicted protein [Histoplasma capsulatum var. duboisii H88]|uniref:Predicted protein n=1 Tax=Ajellomyces capsulatus (strain H88) TaxID=544711 RepID=F0U6W1_AJEC8|nr:predicted protein [Histoplasma capsulatum var. duboisii H88]